MGGGASRGAAARGVQTVVEVDRARAAFASSLASSDEWQPLAEPETLDDGAPKQVLRAASPQFMAWLLAKLGALGADTETMTTYPSAHRLEPWSSVSHCCLLRSFAWSFKKKQMEATRADSSSVRGPRVWEGTTPCTARATPSASSCTRRRDLVTSRHRRRLASARSRPRAGPASSTSSRRRAPPPALLAPPRTSWTPPGRLLDASSPAPLCSSRDL